MGHTTVIQPTPASPSLFGVWLKARRMELDLTRVAFAQRLNCAEITLQKIELGQRRPSNQMAALLAEALSIPDEVRDDFIRFARGTGEPPLLNPQQRHDPKASRSLTNLPALLTSFVDRVRELTEICGRVLHTDVRLLTLVGPPGIGKTRLSIQAGYTLLGQFSDGIWFVPLAPISDPALALPAIARLFAITEGEGLLIEHVQAYLQSRQMLLILDNFEHVLDAAPQVADLLKACPRLKVIGTSRQLLQIYGEHAYDVPALSLPPRNKTLTLEQLAGFDALKLFVARAQAFQPGFEMTPETAQQVADICTRLDGVPLAIELAAAQLRRFTLRTLLDALSASPLHALTGQACDVEPRQRTLHNAIQWSTDLLSSAQRAAFNQLSVFAGGWTMEAALAVGELPDDSLVHALADQSLIQREDDSRWTMLEMIREFALKQLSTEGLRQARQRHAVYFAGRLKKDHAEPFHVTHVTDVEQHNARAALRWLIDHQDSLTSGLAQSMSAYFHEHGLLSEGQQMFAELLSADVGSMGLTPDIRYSLLSAASYFAWQKGDVEDGVRYAHEALALARTGDSPALIAIALIMLAQAYIEMDECAPAKALGLEALEISRRIQHSEWLVGALIQLGEVALMEGNVSQAEVWLEEAYTLCRAPNWQQLLFASITCKDMGLIALIRRDYDRALQFLRESVTHSKMVVLKLWALDALAGVIGTMPRRTTSDVGRAAKIWGAAQVQHELTGIRLPPYERRQIDALIVEARSRMGSKTFEAAWAEGRRLSLDEAIGLAMA